MIITSNIGQSLCGLRKRRDVGDEFLAAGGSTPTPTSIPTSSPSVAQIVTSSNTPSPKPEASNQNLEIDAKTILVIVFLSILIIMMARKRVIQRVRDPDNSSYTT